MTERRKTRRYDLSLSAIVNPNAETVKCRTKDISTGGVFLLLSQPIKNDTDFEVMIELQTEAGVHVQAVARAVRTEQWKEHDKLVVGVAAVIRRYDIVRPASNGSSSHRRKSVA